jgi:hypothetical protein
LAGATVASALWIIAFLRFEDRTPLRFAVAAGAAATVVLLLLTRIIQLPFGWIFS